MANLKSLIELILDEQKIVTYVSASKELCVHVNESKTLLELVVEEIKLKQPNIKLNVNFIVSGLLDDNSARTLVCSEADLDTEKSKFRTLFYQHIYSVSLGFPGVDTAAIVSVNKFEDLSLCSGLIKNNSCLKRSPDEIDTLRSKNQAIEANIPRAPLKKEVKEKPKDIHNSSDHSSDVVKAHASKSEPIKSEVISPNKEKPSTSNSKVNTTNGKKPSKSIAGFFSKANSVPNIKSAKPTQVSIQKQIKPEVKENKEEEMDIDIEEEVPVKNVKEEPESAKKDLNGTLKNSFSKAKETKTKSKETLKRNSSTVKSEPIESPKETKKSSSLSKIKKTAKVDKKRKRVLHVSDSESDEDPFADDKPTVQESDDEIPPTPSTNTVKITSGILNPKKRRKVVDKTYTDEDGYILTRKEEIYESCSDDEVEIKQPEVKIQKENVEKANKISKTEVSPKDKKAKNTKKKISPPQKGKQSTMMNFFKKV